MATKEELRENASLNGRYDDFDQGNYDEELMVGAEAEIAIIENDPSHNDAFETEDEIAIIRENQKQINKLSSEAEIEIMKRMEEMEMEVPTSSNNQTADLNGITAKEKSSVYQNPMTEPVATFGRTILTKGQAKLFGLLDGNGQLKLPFDPNPEKEVKKRAEKEKKAKKVIAMAQEPRCDPNLLVDHEIPGHILKWREEKAAQKKAMLNPRLGYDFISRLNDRGNFLDRAFGKDDNKINKVERQTQEDDYNARLDKLTCPKCKQKQSFDEFIDKRRICGRCNERYVKINISNLRKFEKRVLSRDQIAAKKLAAIEQEMYGQFPSCANTSGMSITQDGRPSSGYNTARTGSVSGHTSPISARSRSPSGSSLGALSARSKSRPSSANSSRRGGGGNGRSSAGATAPITGGGGIKFPELGRNGSGSSKAAQTAPAEILRSLAEQQALTAKRLSETIRSAENKFSDSTSEKFRQLLDYDL